MDKFRCDYYRITGQKFCVCGGGTESTLQS